MTPSVASADPAPGWWTRFDRPPDGRGLDYIGAAFENYGGGLVVGGLFGQAGANVGCNSIGLFSGVTWTSLDGGMNAAVLDLEVLGTDLFAGGDFTNAGGVPANYVARWNGTDWFALGSGVNDFVDALGEFDGKLVAAGRFTQAGGTDALRIAVWDGESWSALGSGIGDIEWPSGSRISAIAEFDGDLYVGGDFDTAGGNPVTSLARWDGVNWSDFGTTLTYSDLWHSSPVEGMSTVYDGSLIVGGAFSHVNGIEVNGLARWDGITWTGIGSAFGEGSKVHSITVYEGDLVVGGAINAPGPIARWNGASWSFLGPHFQYFEITHPVNDLAVLGTDLYVTGAFTSVGNTESYNIARYREAGTPAPIVILPASENRLVITSANPTMSGARFQLSLARPANVDVTILDVAGRSVARIAHGEYEAGTRALDWNGLDETGGRASAGVYFARLMLDGEIAGTERVVLVK